MARASTRLSKWSAPVPNPGKKPRLQLSTGCEDAERSRVGEIVRVDMQISDGKVEAYRAKVRLSFKFED